MRSLLFLLLISSQCFSQSDRKSWLPYQTTSGKWSFILSTGEKLNHLQFDSVGMMHRYTEFAIVHSNGKSGVISWKGDTLVPLTYDFIQSEAVRFKHKGKFEFRHFWIVEINTNYGKLKGLYNESGKQLLPAIFERIYINKGPGEQYLISAFRYSDAKKNSGKTYKYYKLDGTFLADNSVENELFEIDGVFFQKIQKKDQWGRSNYGLLNEFGDTIIRPNKIDIQFGSDRSPIIIIGRNYFTATFDTLINEKWMVRSEAISLDGSLIYHRLRNFYSKEKFDGVHFINARGELIGTSKSNHYVPNKLKNDAGFILTTDAGSMIVDSLGNVLNTYPNYTLEYHESYGNTPDAIDFRDSKDRWGVMDLRGNILIPPTFRYSLYNTWRNHTTNDTISAWIDQEYVSIDLNDWSFIRFPEHEHLSYFNIKRRNKEPFSYFISYKDDKRALLSTDGKVIIPYEWSSLTSGYSPTLDELIFLGKSKRKLVIFTKEGKILQKYNWKKGTYFDLYDDYYWIQTKRKQKVVQIISGEVVLKAPGAPDPSIAEKLDIEFGIYTEPQILHEDPIFIRYYHPKKGSIVVDSAGTILAETSGTNASTVFPIIYQNEVIGSLFSRFEGSYRLAPEITLNGIKIDSSYHISGVINYPSDYARGKSNLIEFYTRDDHHVFFTPEGEFVAKYSNRREIQNGNRIYKSERGYNIYSPNLRPLLPNYFDRIEPLGKICIGQRDGGTCIIFNDSIPTSTVLYDTLARKGKLFEVSLNDTITLYDLDGNMLVDNCLSTELYYELHVTKATTNRYVYWLDDQGEIYLKLDR